jgi:o-succinylbenzoate synthase
MKIEMITLRELRMRLKTPFETSFGVTQERRVLLAEVVVDGVRGWGEITSLESPVFNSETTDTAWHVISDYLAPILIGKEVASASELPALLAGFRGHEMAKAGLENALWDVEARQKGVPLHVLLGGTRENISCGVSLGIRATPEQLVTKVQEELECGYQRIKLKIKPGKDLEFVAAVRNRFPNIMLSVDANSAYDLTDAAHLKKLDEFHLLMMEQPLWWDEIHLHAKLQALLQTPICLDECITNARHAQSAIELGACRIINIKLGRVGGHTSALQVHNVCHERGIPVWCGGMLESGIGRAHNISMSSLPGFTLPGDVSASQRYWVEDIIDPEVEVSREGTIPVPQTPGLGFQVKQQFVERLTTRSRSWETSAAAVSVL